MLVSILHRVTGDGLATLGAVGLVWWLYAIAAGPESYATFQMVAKSPVGWIVLVGLSWAFFQHMLSGIRHLVMDMGAGYELQTNKLWARLIVAFSILLTAAFWAWIILGRAG